MKVTNLQAERRLFEILEVTFCASPESVIAYVQKNFTYDNLNHLSLERRIGTFMDWRARGGFELLEVVNSAPNEIEAVVRAPFTDERWRLALQVEAQAPHRVVALLLGRAPLPVLRPPGGDAETAEAFIGYVERLASAGLFSGSVLIGRHGRVLAQGAFGYANRDFDIPNTLETRFNVASLTKSWTATAICQLVEAGRLDLDEPLARHIAYPDEETAAAIRIRHLLSHTSGLGDYFNAAFEDTSRGRLRELDDFLALARDDRPAFAPGQGWRYSNIGMILLGKVIESVTGTGYHEHVERHVLARAGMADAGFVELDRVNRRVAVGYGKRWTQEGPVMVNSLFDWAVRGGPDGCGYATAADVWAFARAFANGDLVSATMAEEMTRAKPELGAEYYGYGFAVHPERALFGHSGGLIGASANLDITCKPPGWVVVVLANDLSMRTPVLKARQMIGVAVPEAEEGRAHLPRAGMTAR